jgi:glycosyltransferase involved in cell wall biosynthesis
MNDTPLVSIIMPAFNAARYIKEAVDSVLAQSWDNWELIIINDGSTDETASILRSFNDERITVIEQINKGVSAARNSGLYIAKGEFVTFLDSDDILPSRSLEARAIFLVKNHNIDIVDGQVTAKDENLDCVIRIYRPYYTGPLLPRLLMLDDRVFFGPFYMVRKSCLADAHFRVNMSHAEDILFFTLLADKRNLQYAFVNEEIYHYRTRRDSAMSNTASLEDGYLAFMRTVFTSMRVSYRQRVYLRLKISKIMFLTWANRRKYMSAIASVYKCVFFT